MMLWRLAIPMVALVVVGTVLFGAPSADAATDVGSEHVTASEPATADADAGAAVEPWLLAAAVAIVSGALWMAVFATPRREGGESLLIHE